jgi:alanyl-tRNA synthetase
VASTRTSLGVSGVSGSRQAARTQGKANAGADDEVERTMPEQSEKQFDPRMHSAEHIVNQTMIRMFHSGRCFSAHIEKRKSKLDYHLDRQLSDDEVRDLENRVNEVILADLPVTELFMPRTEARNHFNLERLPESAGDILRIIRIGDYDACPCIGPHVKSTGEIGPFRVISTSFEAGVLRIRYKLGKAAGTDSR